MKAKVFLLTVAMMLMAVVPSRSQAPDEIQQIVDMINATLPITIDENTRMVSVGYEAPDLVCHLEVIDDAEGLAIDVMNQNPSMFKKQMLGNIARMGDEFVDAMESYGMGVTYVYTGKASKKQFVLAFGLDELRAAQKMEGATGQNDVLTQSLEMVNAMCPMKVNAFLTMKRAVIEGNTFYYDYEVDENVGNLSAIESNLKGAGREAVKAQLSNPSLAAFKAACKRQGKGIGYRYIGASSGRVVEVVFPASEL